MVLAAIGVLERGCRPCSSHPWVPKANDGLTETTAHFNSVSYPKLWLTLISWCHLLEHGVSIIYLLGVFSPWVKDKKQNYWVCVQISDLLRAVATLAMACRFWTLQSTYHLGHWKHIALVLRLARVSHL